MALSRWWKSHRDKDREALMEAMAALRDVGVATAKAQEAQALAMRDWLASFQTQQDGFSSVVTIEDELQRQTDRDAQQLSRSGFPTTASAHEQAEWLRDFMSTPL